MTETAFSPEVDAALNRYAVPSIPQGFTDRLMARIASSDTIVGGTAPNHPPSRQRQASPWRRTSRIIGSVALCSLATATAAASGFFGRPVYLPGISEVLVEAKIVDAPKKAAEPRRPVLLAETTTPAAPVAQAPPLTGSAAIVDKVTALRNDPEFAALPPRQRRAVARKEVITLIRSGEATRSDVRTAVRELVQNADPQTKTAWRDAAMHRREERLERRGLVDQARPEPEAIGTTEPSALTEAVATTEVLPATLMTPLVMERAAELRERYRRATPEQRTVIREAVRQRRQVRQQRRPQ